MWTATRLQKPLRMSCSKPPTTPFRSTTSALVTPMPLSAQSRRTPTPTRSRRESASGSSRSFCPSRLRLPSRRSTMPSSSAGRQTRGTETTTWACTSRRGTPRASTTPEATTSRGLSAAMTQRSANATSMRSLRSCARCARWCPPAPTPTSSP